jgi:hypothetical protein
MNDSKRISFSELEEGDIVEVPSDNLDGVDYREPNKVVEIIDSRHSYPHGWHYHVRDIRDADGEEYILVNMSGPDDDSFVVPL